MSCIDLLELPQECLIQILSSLTSPGDVLRSSLASKQLLSLSDSDALWGKFLPSICDQIFSQSNTPLDQFTSKKDLYLHLRRSHVLFNNHTQSFELEKRSGKNCYMLGAKALEIEWGDNSQYWTWKEIPGSRFQDAAELVDVCWLDIKGKIDTKLLTPDTTYGAYFVFKTNADNFRGFDTTQVKVCVSVVDEEGSSQNQHHTAVVRTYYLKAPKGRRQSSRRPPTDLPVARDDGWMEIEMGRYQVGVDHGDHVGVSLEMTLKEVEHLHWKGGIIVEGVQLRPLD